MIRSCNHTHIQETKSGHEDQNFRAIGGYYYGYAPHSTDKREASIDLHRRFGAKAGADYLDGVTVVWTARAPGGGVYVVGWYENARLYATLQEEQHRLFLARARVGDCTLLPVPKRKLRIENPQRQGAVWYGRSNVIAAVERLIATGPSDTGATPKKRKMTDTALRIRIEMIGMERTRAHLEDEGYEVEYVHRDNKGYDLTAEGAGVKLLVEVKATMQPNAVVDLTPNEYGEREHRDYRIAVVSDALKNPTLLIFRRPPGKNKPEVWVDESGKRRLRFKEVMAARLTVE